MGNARRLLLVHAHPDDESITTGGTIARYAAENVEVTIVTCTLGEEGEIIPRDLDQLGSWAGDQLGGYRAGELAAAGSALGWAAHRYLGGIGRWRDSGMAGSVFDGASAVKSASAQSAEHPRAFVKGSPAEQARQLRAVLDEIRPQVVVSYDEHGGYGHPDHVRAHEITMAATEGAESVARVFHTVTSAEATSAGLARLREDGGVPFRVAGDGELPTTPDAEITTTVDVRDHVPAKLAALRAHATQVEVPATREPCFALSNGVAQPVPGAEFFVLVRGQAAGAELDLFGGLQA